MEKITATFRVVTPLFMSGADQTRAELRLASIKGALRFWWRALAWAKYQGDMKAIHQAESELFGSADQEIGQAKVLMKLEPTQAPSLAVGNVLNDGGQVVGDGARYLGYGVMESFASRNKGTEAGQLTRPCLQAPFTFTCRMLLRPELNSADIVHLLKALKLMGILGGLGSKARKGYGSITLTGLSYTINDKTSNDEAIKKVLKLAENHAEVARELTNFKSYLAQVNATEEPPYTALSTQSRFIVIKGNARDSALSLLNRIGREQVFYRSWGKNGRVLGETREENFQADHDLMKHLPADIRYPERIAFGLPHNYGKRKELHVEPENHDRRASPLFIHIHQSKEEHPPFAIVSFLPAKFLPENESITLLNRVEPFEQTTDFWQPIGDFLERLKGEKDGQPYQQRPLKRKGSFAQVEEILTEHNTEHYHE